jgi:hypothetical protein
MSTGGPSFWQKIEYCIRTDDKQGKLNKIAYVAINIKSAVFLVTNEKITADQLVKALIEVYGHGKASVGKHIFNYLKDKSIELEVFIVVEEIGGGYATMTTDGKVV